MSTIAIVGFGFAGILWATKLKQAGHKLIIFEKRDALGGVWSHFANTNSHNQIAEHDYRFRAYQNQEEIIDSFATRDTILHAAKHLSNTENLLEDVLFNTEVTDIQRLADDQYQIIYREKNTIKTLFVNNIVILTGLLQQLNTLTLPNESQFYGKLAYGVSDDVKITDYKDKNVVIIGMGSFAIENARTALLHGAKKVTLVCRSINIVFSKYFHHQTTRYLTFKGNSALKLIRYPYELIGREDLLEKLDGDFIRNQNVVSPVSDFFFLALYHKRLTIFKDTVKQVNSHSVTLSAGDTIECDLIIKNIGFNQDATNEHFHQLVGDVNYNTLFIDQKPNLAYCREPNLSARNVVKLGFFTISYLYAQELTADLFLYYSQHPTRYDKIKAYLPEFKPEQFDLNKSEHFLNTIAQKDAVARNIIIYWLSQKIARSYHRFPSNKQFHLENKQNWEQLNNILANGEAPLAYPFEEKHSFFIKIINKIVIVLAKWRYRKIYKKYLQAKHLTVENQQVTSADSSLLN